jgi:hypothetical protein
VCLIALILISGYRRAAKAFQRYPEFGSLILAYIATGIIYNVTEAGFRELNLCWIFLLLGVFSGSGVAAGFLRCGKPKIPASRGSTASRTDATNKLAPESETMYAACREVDVICSYSH